MGDWTPISRLRIAIEIARFLDICSQGRVAATSRAGYHDVRHLLALVPANPGHRYGLPWRPRRREPLIIHLVEPPAAAPLDDVYWPTDDELAEHPVA